METKRLNAIIGMSRPFVRVKVTCNELQKWSLMQNKLFMLILAKINWKENYNANLIELLPDELFSALGWTVHPSETRKYIYMAKKEYEYMVKHSCITLVNPYTKKSATDSLLIHVDTNGYGINVALNPLFMPHFERLYALAQDAKVPFLTFLLDEELNFKSKYAFPMLWELKSCGKTGGAINEHKLSTKQLKELFGMTVDDYVTFNKNTGEERFDRYKFEIRVLNRAIYELNQTSMIKLLPWDDGNLYFKEKDTKGKVTGYIFRYQIFNIENKRTQNNEPILYEGVENNG